MGTRSKLFPEEVHNFFRDHNQGTTAKDMAQMLNDRFGKNYTVGQIKAYRARNKWNSGLTGTFPKGHVPHNKGKKWDKPGSRATRFQKGNRPHNAQPIGTEVVSTVGYLVRKIAEPDVWKAVHYINWEAAHGPVPENHCIIFKDQNHLNCDLDNLLLVSRGELAVMNRRNLCASDPQLTETGHVLAKLICTVAQTEKKKRKRRRPT